MSRARNGAAPDVPAPSRHGTTQTEEARRASGKRRINVRITDRQYERLQWIHEEDGHDLSTIIGCAIDQEYEERQGK